MSQFRREYFQLKRADAVDIADPRSFTVRRNRSSLDNGSEYQTRKAFCALHSNRNCFECKKRKLLAQKKRKQRTLAMDVLVNDYNGFKWIDQKMNGFQALNVAGRGVKRAPDILNDDGFFQRSKLFFPALSLNRSVPTTDLHWDYRKVPKDGYPKKDGLSMLNVLAERTKKQVAFPGKLHGKCDDFLDPFGSRNDMSFLRGLFEDKKQSFEGSARFSGDSLLRKGIQREAQSSKDNEGLYVLPKARRHGSFQTSENENSILHDEDNECLKMGSSNDLQVLESTKKERRRTSPVVLPRIS